MRNPIENLGDYNTIREDLLAAGGCRETLYKNIGDTAVIKVTPDLLLKGGVIGSVITIVVIYLGYKGYCFWKDRKQKIENEPALKKDFFEAVEGLTSTES